MKAKQKNLLEFTWSLCQANFNKADQKSIFCANFDERNSKIEYFTKNFNRKKNFNQTFQQHFSILNEINKTISLKNSTYFYSKLSTMNISMGHNYLNKKPQKLGLEQLTLLRCGVCFDSLSTYSLINFVLSKS